MSQINVPQKQPGDTLSHIEVNDIVSGANSKADLTALDSKADKVAGLVPLNQLPPVYFEGMTGSGTQADPYVTNSGFSPAALVGYLQSLPNWGPGQILQGDMTWIAPPSGQDLEVLATPLITFGTPANDAIQVNISTVPNAVTTTIQRASSAAFTDAVTIYSGPNHGVLATGLVPATTYYFRAWVSAPGFAPSANASGNSTTSSSGDITPSAPTNGVVDDANNTFGFTVNPTYTSLSEYEYQINSGTITTVSANPIVVGNIAVPIGGLKVRVKAAAGRNVSAWLTNTTAFTIPQVSTTPLTEWQSGINFGTLTDNSLLFTTTSSFGQAVSKYMIPAGGTGWVEFTASAALNGAILLDIGEQTFSNRDSSGTASKLALDYANSRFQTWVAGNDNFANPRPAFGPNTKGRIRLDGTNAYFEESIDAGANWVLMRTAAQPQLDLYVKAWVNVNQSSTPINNIRGNNLTLIS